MRLWRDVKRLMINEGLITDRRWNKAVAAAKLRYRRDIREHRGISRLRSMYRRKRSSRW